MIAKADYFKTSVTATRLGLPGFILPFMFVYHQELLLQGNIISIVAIVFSSFVGLFCMCACFEGCIPKAERNRADFNGCLRCLRNLARNKDGYYLLCDIYCSDWRAVYAEQEIEESG